MRTIVILSLCITCQTWAATSKTKRLAPTNPTDHFDLRNRAESEIQVVTPKTEQEVVPSVMLPIKDQYKPGRERKFKWTFQGGIYRHKILVEKPSGEFIGRRFTEDLGEFSFVELGMGAKKNWDRISLGVGFFGNFSTKPDEAQSLSGYRTETQIQWTGIGGQIRGGFMVLPKFDLIAAYSFENSTVSQNSPISSFARWSQSFNSQAYRLGLGYEIFEQQSIQLYAQQKSAPLGSTRSGVLAWESAW